jgi:hypothetical protein
MMTNNNKGDTTMKMSMSEAVTMGQEPVHEPTAEQVKLACDWHGGQSSMLYAVASTGALKRGTVQPYGSVTVAEWNVDLLDRLHGELVRTAQEADDHHDSAILRADGPALREWADDVAVLLAEWETIAEQETGQ